MTASKQCPSCGKQWPADVSFCRNCATSLHNVAVVNASTIATSAYSSIPARVDDEYITMFRPTGTTDPLVHAHIRRVDDTLMWAHVQRLTMVVWIRYAMAGVAGLISGAALITLISAGGLAAVIADDGWTVWHGVAVVAIAWSIHQATSALAIQAQRDMLVMSLRTP